MNIFYLGPKNSYHYHAGKLAIAKLAKSTQDKNTVQDGFFACSDFAEVFINTIQNPEHFGIVALYNSIAGEVTEVSQLMKKYQDKIKIITKISMQIHLNLIGLKTANLHEITTVFSHPKALAESSNFLEKNKIKTVPTSSTSQGLSEVFTLGNPKNGAIGHQSLADNKNCIVLSKNIENNPNNVTYFAIISGIIK